MPKMPTDAAVRCLLLALTCALTHRPVACLLRWACDRVPDTALRPAKIGDGGYEVRVLRPNDSREATSLTPGAEYDVEVLNRFRSVTFNNFFLVAVPSDATPRSELTRPIGQFQHSELPAVTQADPDCPGVATAIARGRRLARVRLRWTAPARPPACVSFRATVEYVPQEYFKDADRLTKTLCLTRGIDASADVMMSDSAAVAESERPKRRRRIERCCACGHAVYRMEVRGVWTRHNHPRDFPSDSDGRAKARWTSIIGATHTSDYGIFYIGGPSNSGVAGVCARGDTNRLEAEFKDKGSWNILNVIKTHGLWGEDSLNDARTALFSVNKSHHLLSFITKLQPSPDWCAGVDDLDLCEGNCTWKKELRMPLIPWDAGVVTGDTYEPAKSTEETEPIAFLGNDADFKRGPFQTDESGRARPVAELVVTRTRPSYDWNCETDRPQSDKPGSQREPQLTWTSQRRQQERQLATAYPDTKEKLQTKCMTSPWSAWSSCSRTCGHLGFRTRERRQEIAQPSGECDKLYNLTETEDCGMSKISCEDNDCSTTSWNSWGECSGSCMHSGAQSRRRKFVSPEKCPSSRQREILLEEIQGCLKVCHPKSVCGLPFAEGNNACKRTSRTAFYYNVRARRCYQFDYRGCDGNDNRFSSEESCLRFCKHGLRDVSGAELKALADKQAEALEDKGIERCQQPSDSGDNCSRNRSNQVKWYFDYSSGRCQQFSYNGCGGNTNRFDTKSDCVRGCSHLLPSGIHHCFTSRWSQWGACTAKCGGHRTRSRQVLRAPANGGRPCGQLEDQEACPRCCEYTQWSTWSSCSRTCSLMGAPSLRERRRQRTTPEDEECTAMTMVERRQCRQYTNAKCPGH